jgi:hypothetical protein
LIRSTVAHGVTWQGTMPVAPDHAAKPSRTIPAEFEKMKEALIRGTSAFRRYGD